ncbi:MAG: 4Fe-4S binding protein [Clostridia bacterium]|nr:4Fe-4S binding protein [Clostridia bacterium]
MKILLAAQKDLKARFSAALIAAGADVTAVDDPEILSAVDGECGAFTYRLGGQPRSAERIVLAGGVNTDPLLSDDEKFSARLDRQHFDRPLVIVAGASGQAPACLTGIALRRALEAVRRRRPAVLFAKDVRTSDADAERLYREARQAGVAVIRCRTIEISREDGRYSVRSSDGVTDTRVDTDWVIDAGAGIAPELAAFAQKLRLRPSAGCDTAGRYWLYPAFTSRRGVSFIDTSLLPMGAIEDAARALARPAAQVKAAHAHVDPVKCAFCYTCYRACPHAALAPDTAAPAMLVRETACDACGICAAICPANAIELLESPAAKSGVGRGALKIIACEHSAFHAAMAVFDGRPQDYDVCIESVPCCGSVTGRQITSSRGDFDAVLVAACMEDACHHFDGNIRGCVHAKRLIQDMARMGLAQTVAFCNASASMAGPLRREIDRLLDVPAASAL